MTYFVEGISNHLAPETQVRRIGEYATMADAIVVAQKTVEAYLQQALRPGMDAKTLFAQYRAEGEYPFIFRDDDKTFNVPGFNHAHYAMNRATELCREK